MECAVEVVEARHVETSFGEFGFPYNRYRFTDKARHLNLLVDEYRFIEAIIGTDGNVQESRQFHD